MLMRRVLNIADNKTEIIMLKYALLAGAMIASVPAIAQEQPQTVPSKAANPAATDVATTPDQTTAPAQTPMTAEPATGSSATSTDAAMGTTGTTMTAATATATGSDKIAQVVDTEFPTYDKDANGSLSATEFGTWMTALRSASDASVKAGSKEMKAWTTTAFAQADIDKSKSVSKSELTGFLAKG